MGPLIAIAAVLQPAGAWQEAPQADRRWAPQVAEASQRFGISADWIGGVMRAESGGRTTLHGRPITSPKGAMGLMQLMPATYAAMARQHGLGPDPHLPRDNILAGAAYLRAMYDRFGYPGLFAAYNAGPGRYEAWLRGRSSLPNETRIYLARLLSEPFAIGLQRSPAGSESAPASLFFRLSREPNAAAYGANAQRAGGLFVPLRVDEPTLP